MGNEKSFESHSEIRMHTKDVALSAVLNDCVVGAESKYHSSKFLALQWAICEHFRDYLYYVDHFQVFTDVNPRIYLTSTCKVNAPGQRWVNELTDSTVTTNYKPGLENKFLVVSAGIHQSTWTTSSVKLSQMKLKHVQWVNQPKSKWEAWIPVINNINCSANSSENELIYDEGDTPTKNDIKLISYQ